MPVSVALHDRTEGFPPRGGRPRRHGLKLTLRQMMKLVVFGAIASATVTPMLRFAQMGAVGWPFAILLDAVAVPIVLAIAAFPLVQRGSLRDWVIRLLLLTSMSVIIGAAIYTLVWASTGPPALNIWAGSMLNAMTVGFIRAVLVILVIPFIALLGKVVPTRCPTCQTLTLLPDGISVDPSKSGPQRTRWCASCQRRFQKVFGSWWAISSHSSAHL
jgi:hypothetical protein